MSVRCAQDAGLAALMEVLSASGCVTELKIQNIQAGVNTEQLSFDPRHSGGHHRLDLSVTYDRWIAKMLKRQALTHPGDSWMNVTLDSKPFEMCGVTAEWEIPDAGILELDYVPCEGIRGRRVKHCFDLSDPMERVVVERLWQRMLLIPEEQWEHVTWNAAKLKPSTTGRPWKIPPNGTLIFEHIVRESSQTQSSISLTLDLADEMERELLHQLLMRSQVRVCVCMRVLLLVSS